MRQRNRHWTCAALVPSLRVRTPPFTSKESIEPMHSRCGTQHRQSQTGRRRSTRRAYDAGVDGGGVAAGQLDARVRASLPEGPTLLLGERKLKRPGAFYQPILFDLPTSAKATTSARQVRWVPAGLVTCAGAARASRSSSSGSRRTASSSPKKAHNSNLYQLFMCEPIDGIKIELNFAWHEALRLTLT